MIAGAQKCVKTVFLGVFLAAAMAEPLSAQARVFLEGPKSGAAVEHQYFISHLSQTAQALGWEPVGTKEESDLYITTTITTTSEMGLHTIIVELYNTETGEFIATNAMGYSDVLEMDEWNRLLIYELMSKAPILDRKDAVDVQEPDMQELSLSENRGADRSWFSLPYPLKPNGILISLTGGMGTAFGGGLALDWVLPVTCFAIGIESGFYYGAEEDTQVSRGDSDYNLRPIKFQVFSIPILARVSYHQNVGVPKLDVYAMAKVGFGISGSLWGGGYVAPLGGFVFSIGAGVRYFFNERFAVFAEGGYHGFYLNYELIYSYLSYNAEYDEDERLTGHKEYQALRYVPFSFGLTFRIK